jgi:hypothetical protein
LNGITATGQTFAATTTSTSTTPSFTSTGTVHTLNIPSASVTGTTAGLLSNTDYNTFSSAITSATSSNTANMIVKRDGSGGFAAGLITATSLTSSGNISSTSINTGTVTATSLVTNTLKVTGGLYTTTGAVLTSDGNGNATWGSSGLYTLNGITATGQTFAATTTSTSTTPSFTSTGTVHTLNIPSASVTGTTAGLLSNTDYNTFSSAITSATSSNTLNTIVKRDGSGNFAAGAITATSLTSSGNISSTSINTGTVTATSLVTNTLKVTGGLYTTTGAVLTSDGNGNATWGSSGLYTLNGITATGQTFAATTTSTSTTPSFTSTGTVHTLNIPSASVTGTTAGLISNAEFKSKVNVVDTAAMLATYAKRFTKNVTLNIAAGKSLGKYQNGQTIPAAGKTMDEFLSDIATETISPIYTSPTVRMNPNTNQTVEIGYNPGTISLGNVYTQNDGGAVTTTTYFKNDVSLGTAVSNAPGSITSDLTYKVNVAYAQGPIKNDNLGNPDATGRIGASNVTSDYVTYTPQAKKYWGSSTSNTIDFSSFGDKSSEYYSSPAKATFSIAVTSAKFIYYAYPATGDDLTSISVGGFESINSFTKSTINITNAQGYTQSYKLYVSNNNFSANVTNIIIQ